MTGALTRPHSDTPQSCSDSATPVIAARAARLPESATVRIADLASALRARGETVIDLSAGRAAEATDPEICEEAINALRDGDTHQTPARGTPEYRAAVADKLKRENQLSRDPDTEIIATMGCKNGLTLALLSLLDPGDEVIVEDPCFVSYQPTIALCGGVAVNVPTQPANGWRWRPEDLEAAITPRTKAILYCSPGNPTGAVHTERDLETLAAVALRHNLVVIADEIYEAVTWDGRRHHSIARLPGMGDRTIGLMGMTKSYSMGGWRIGYAYAPAPICERMVMIQQHLMTCASSIAQRAGAVALSEPVTRRLSSTVWQDWETRVVFLSDALNAAPGLTCARPKAGFYAWVDISGTGLNSEAFVRQLLEEESVTVVPGGAFGPSTDSYIRATCVKSWDDISEAAKRITNFARRITSPGQ